MKRASKPPSPVKRVEVQQRQQLLLRVPPGALERGLQRAPRGGGECVKLGAAGDELAHRRRPPGEVGVRGANCAARERRVGEEPRRAQGGGRAAARERGGEAGVKLARGGAQPQPVGAIGAGAAAIAFVVSSEADLDREQRHRGSAALAAGLEGREQLRGGCQQARAQRVLLVGRGKRKDTGCNGERR